MRAKEAALERRRRRLRKQLDELGNAIAIVESELSEKSDLPNDAPIALLPSGSQNPLTPYFVEVRKGGLRLRKANGSWSEEFHLTDLVQKGRFKVFLEHVRSVMRGTVIFLIRPDGTATYEEARDLADASYVRNGKLPIPSDGLIDFRLVEGSGPPSTEQ